jgi:hypothetical protein
VWLNDGHRENGAVEERAVELLGLTHRDTFMLFYDFTPFEGLRIGSPKYAAEGVRGMRAFMLLHATHLKARSLRGV